MEPARYTLTLRGQGPEVAGRLHALLNGRGAPRVSVELSGVELTFVCETWEPILLSRVRDVIAAELGEDVSR